MKDLIVVGQNPALLLNVSRMLGAAGFGVEVAAPTADLPVRWSRYVNRFHRVPPGFGPATFDALPAGRLIVPADLDATRMLAGRGLAFPVPELRILELAADKAKFSAFLDSAGLPQPQTQIIDDRSVLTRRAFEPCLLKPAIGGNSEGVRRIGTPADLADYLAHEDRPGQLLVQEYLQGEDIDCSVLADRGEVVAWTCQRPLADPFARELLYDEETLSLARQTVRALGYHGVGHFDMRRDGDGHVRILELNTRFWMSIQYSAWAGLDFAALAVRMARGESISQPAFTPGIYWQPRLVPRSLIRQLSHLGHRGAATALWLAVSDPLPQAVRKFGAWLG